jgi:hypothetical protein
MRKQHIVIAGTGRAGTSCLVELFDACGFDTNSANLGYFPEARAGLETDLSSPDAPEVVKAPYLSFALAGLIRWGFDPQRVKVIIIPMRELDDAVASRLERFESSGLGAPGGLWGNERPSRQKSVIAEAVHGLFVTASRHNIPVVLLDFPGFVTDADRAWAGLGPVLSDRVTRDQFLDSHAAVMRPGDVHKQKRYSALALARLDVRWYRLRVIRRVRRLLGQARRAISPKASMARRVWGPKV